MERLSRRRCDFEYWGGIECTLNRVGDRFLDQLQLTGHYTRSGDIERIASLGISRMRYPVLWERHQPARGSTPDWSWTGKRLAELRQHNIVPIAGLLHHGSGPAFTRLDDPAFPRQLAAYASMVARQFPWIDFYTPVNEPLTTARFSGLYGHWYPHERDSRSFLRMLLNQIQAIALSMRAIREVNPAAKLVQTEDLSKVFSSPELAYQADFENERRWLSYDLLCGRVGRHHPLWDYLRDNGIGEEELLQLQDDPCTPDIAGFNYYVTSERFLDAAIENYPTHLHGGNGRDLYVDTEAIRVDHPNPSGLAMLLREAHERFHLPMAVTEVFLSCTEDEQVRWAHDVCNQVQQCRLEGLPVNAVTFWALFGERGWNTLVTSADGEYEAGAFDVREGRPRETLLAAFIRSRCSGTGSDPVWVQDAGWWRRSDRVHQPLVCASR